MRRASTPSTRSPRPQTCARTSASTRPSSRPRPRPRSASTTKRTGRVSQRSDRVSAQADPRAGLRHRGRRRSPLGRPGARRGAGATDGRNPHQRSEMGLGRRRARRHPHGHTAIRGQRGPVGTPEERRRGECTPPRQPDRGLLGAQGGAAARTSGGAVARSSTTVAMPSAPIKARAPASGGAVLTWAPARGGPARPRAVRLGIRHREQHDPLPTVGAGGVRRPQDPLEPLEHPRRAGPRVGVGVDGHLQRRRARPAVGRWGPPVRRTGARRAAIC